MDAQPATNPSIGLNHLPLGAIDHIPNPLQFDRDTVGSLPHGEEILGEFHARRRNKQRSVSIGPLTTPSSCNVLHIRRKGRQQVTDCVAHLDATRAGADPWVFTRIHAHFTVTGKAHDPQRVGQTMKLSAEEYCSASIMLGNVAEITHDSEGMEG